MKRSAAAAGPAVFVSLDGRLGLDQLVRLAAEFDGIEPGGAYPAAEFVTWLRREVQHRQAVREERIPPRRPSPQHVAG